MSPKRKRTQIHDANNNNNNGKQKKLCPTKRNSELNNELADKSSRRRTRSAKEVEEHPNIGKIQVVENLPKKAGKNVATKDDVKKSSKKGTGNEGNKRKAQKQKGESFNDNESCNGDMIEEQRKTNPCAVKGSWKKNKSKTNSLENDNEDFQNTPSNKHVEKTDCGDKKEEPVTADSSSESEWEDVSEASDDDREPIIPKEGVEITLEGPNLFNRKGKKKQFDFKDYLRMRVNRFKKELQVNLHKVHLLCLLARGLYVNNLCSDEVLKGLALSILPSEFQCINIKKANETIIKKILNWYTKEWKLENIINEYKSYKEYLILGFDLKNFNNSEVYVCAFVIILRTLGFDVRLVIAFHPISFKPKDLIKRKSENKCNSSASCSKELRKTDLCKSKNKNKTSDEKKATGESSKKSKNSKKLCDDGLKTQNDKNHSSASRSGRTRLCVKKPVVELNGSEEDEEESSSSQNVKKNAKQKEHKNGKYSKENTEQWNSDDDFEVQIIKEQAPKPAKFKKNRKIKSEDENEENDDTICGNNFWIEVYLESEKKWLCVDCISCKINCIQHMEAQTKRSLSYVVAVDNYNNVKDVTLRYAENWMSQTQKLRIDSNWWNETLHPFRGYSSDRDKAEDSALEINLHERPLPSTIGEFKNHQLYVLKRHLLKFEAIYPSDAPPVGFIRGEPVYARECVKNLHSRETWLKEARMVRIGEEPYKIVKARPKRNRWTGEMESNQPLEVYGIWQTEEYIPPVAANGKVPRNEYGNVELFKPSMLPIGTVVLKVPGLNRVARKLGIDCAPAMIGWDYHSGGSHPLYDGWVVCEEFHDTLMDAWHEQQKILEEKEREKRDKRIYGNWRRLIKGLLIRERLKARYANTEES